MAEEHDPSREDESADDGLGGTEDGDRYIPTPEEIEGGDAPRLSEGSAQEEISEESPGFFERLKMRRRRGVGKGRKYVSPEPQADAGGEGNEPPDSSRLAAAPGDEPPDEDERRAETESPAASDPQADAEVEEDGPDASEQTVETDEGNWENELDQPEDKGSEPGPPPPPAQRVGSVSIDRPREKEPKPKPEPKPEPVLSPRETRTAKLFTVAAEHGHSMGELKPDLGSNNSTARCGSCRLRATLVGSRDDMSTYIRWDIRGAALERKCEP